MMTERTKMLFSITARGNGRKWIEEMKKQNIGLHLQSNGKGTASSDMLDILGFDNTDKDIVISFGSENAVNAFAAKMSESIRGTSSYNGIVMVLGISAINRLIAVISSKSQENTDSEGKIQNMKSEFDYSLVLIAVNQGYTDKVMQTAKKAGATGGTVIRARLADSEHTGQFYGLNLQEEKEVVAIMTPGSTRDEIMEEVNREFGLRTDAQAIICALPVDKAFKI